jgi:hypothetical protein
MIKLQYEEAQAFNIKMNKKAIKLMDPEDNLMSSMDFSLQHSEFILFLQRDFLQRQIKDLNEFFGD